MSVNEGIVIAHNFLEFSFVKESRRSRYNWTEILIFKGDPIKVCLCIFEEG